MSLLQDFVLDFILGHFAKSKISVTPIKGSQWESTSKFVPFLVEVSEGEGIILDSKSLSASELHRKVKVFQMSAMMGSRMTTEWSKGQSFELETEEAIDGVPRYRLLIRDHTGQAFAKKTMGVFVVPLGMEREMQILLPSAQEKLRDQADFSRLVIVLLSKGHTYASL